jgi:acyl carrier protein
MTSAEVPSREDVLAIIAAQADCAPASVPEKIDSLGVAWLVYEAERRFGIALELDDDLLDRMSTVDGAVEVLRAAHRQGVRAGD